MSDLIYLLDQLVDLKGNIIIKGINDDVLPLTDDERATYTDIDFDKVSKESYDQANLTCIIDFLPSNCQKVGVDLGRPSGGFSRVGCSPQTPLQACALITMYRHTMYYKLTT